MFVKKLNSRIIKYKVCDEDMGVLYYTLDLDRYQLSISGETQASYKWVETTEKESFIKLMLRCDKWYLSDKLFEKVFDIDASIESVKEYIKEHYENEDKHTIKSILSEIDDLLCNDMYFFVNSIENLLQSNDLEVETYDLYDCCEKKYKRWDEKAITYFCEYIKPELRKELESEDTE